MHRITQEIPRRARVFGYGSVTLYGAIFHSLHLTFALPQRAPTTPSYFLCSALLFRLPLLGKECFERLRRSNRISGFKAHEVAGFSLFRFRSPLLTESLSISVPPVTEMFHFTGCRDVPAMYSQKLEQVLPYSGYPIRKSTGQSVFAAHRSLTQLTTSFIAYWHQGIHDALFVA